MPIVLKKGEIAIKDRTTGEYDKYVNVVAEQTTEDMIEDIQQEGAAQIGLVEAKGVETLDSIPDDYTELSNEVDHLEYLNYFENMDSGLILGGYWNSANGDWITNADYFGTQKFPCTSGDIIKIVFSNVSSHNPGDIIHLVFWDRYNEYYGRALSIPLVYDSETDSKTATYEVTDINYRYVATYASIGVKDYFKGSRIYSMPFGCVDKRGLTAEAENDINESIEMLGVRATHVFNGASTFYDISEFPHRVHIKIKSRNLFYKDGSISSPQIGVSVTYDDTDQSFTLNGTTSGIGNIILSNAFKVPELTSRNTIVFKLFEVSGSITYPEGSTIYVTAFNQALSSYTNPRIVLQQNSPSLSALTRMPVYDESGYKMLLQCTGVAGITFNNYKFKLYIQEGNDLRPTFSPNVPINNVPVSRINVGEYIYKIKYTDEYGDVAFSSSYPSIGILVSSSADASNYIACIDYLLDSTKLLEGHQWKDKKWYAFGTSITDDSFINAEDGVVTGKYTGYLKDLSGLNCINNGIAGGAIGGASHSILTRILDTDVSDADLITVEGFVNDFAAAVPIGNITDTTSDTLCGAIYLAISYLQQSNATVILLTDNTGRQYTLSGGVQVDYRVNRTNSLGLLQRDYNDAIIKMAKYMGCHYIDAGTESQINQWHTQYLTDHLHQSYLGGEQYAQTIWSKLKDIYPLK